ASEGFLGVARVELVANFFFRIIAPSQEPNKRPVRGLTFWVFYQNRRACRGCRRRRRLSSSWFSHRDSFLCHAGRSRHPRWKATASSPEPAFCIPCCRPTFYHPSGRRRYSE